MMNRIFKLAIAASAIAALPGVAHAGTATATGTVTLTVVDQCAVTGANVNLGTYAADNTWDDVAKALGKYDGTTYTAGSRGQEYLNYGSITCSNGIGYTLTIKGSATNGGIKINHNGKTAVFMPAIKKLAGTVVADTAGGFAGAGARVATSPLAGTGTGAAQALLGNVTLIFDAAAGTTAAMTGTLGVAGTATDTLNYTLNF